MPWTNAVPSAAADAVEWADWLELEALRVDDASVSHQTLIQALRRTGSAEVIAGADNDSDASEAEAVAAAAFGELEKRALACPKGVYPYEFKGSTVVASSKHDAGRLYLVLLLLSTKYPGATVTGVGKTHTFFEGLSLDAAAKFLSAEHSFHFGHPRPGGPKKFADAVDRLCNSIREGGGIKDPKSARLREAKDAGLDVVVWKGFPDGKAGQLVLVGQCAIGEHWRPKARDFRFHEFRNEWLRDTFLAPPIQAFFVPHRVSDKLWQSTGLRVDGIVFDRCRIVSCLADSLSKTRLDAIKKCGTQLAKQMGLNWPQ